MCWRVSNEKQRVSLQAIQLSMFHLDRHDKLSSDEYLPAFFKTDGKYSGVPRRKNIITLEISAGPQHGNKGITLDDLRKICYNIGLLKLEGLSHRKTEENLAG